MGGKVAASWDQLTFLFRNDDGTAATATAKETAGSDTTATHSDKFRIRFVIQETAGSNQAETPNWGLQFAYNGGGYGAIAASGGELNWADSSNLTNGTVADNTQRVGSGTFNSGCTVDNAGTSGAQAATAGNDEYEVEFTIQIASSGLSNGDTIDLRVYQNGGALTSYTDTARITLTGIADALIGQDITVGTPAPEAGTITQEHVLTGQDVASGTPTTTSNATLTEVVALTGQDITGGTPTVEAGTLGQTHVITGQDVLGTAPIVEAGTLGQTHVITGQDTLGTAPVVEAGTLGQEHALTSQDTLGTAPIVEAGTLGQTHAITGQDVAAGTPTTTSNATLVDVSGTPTPASEYAYIEQKMVRPGLLRTKFRVSTVPIGARATEDSIIRITEDGQYRITEDQ